MIKQIQDLVAEHPFFQGLPPAHQALVAGCGRLTQHEPDSYLGREGQEADRFYLLRQGKVAVELNVPQRGPVILETVAAGSVLGWSWLFPPHRWDFDLRAVEPVRAISFDGTCLRRKCQEDPALGYAFMTRFAQVLVQRLGAARVRLLDVYGHRPA